MKDLSILNQFQGFVETPDIFTASKNDLKVFTFPKVSISEKLILDLMKIDHPRNSVLGKRMESFFEIAIDHSERYDLMAANIQIIQEKQTHGELDFLVFDKENSRPLHVELVYKLYVYDPSFPKEIEKWIGPNRRDSLLQKQDKLRTKQFPLLHKPETEAYLSKMNLSADEIEQQLCFKAQLYTPVNYKPDNETVNLNGLRGHWYRYEDFLNMNWQENQFFSPKKKYWSCDPKDNSNWISYSELLNEIEFLFEKKKAPLIWMKTKSGYHRFFIVWW